MPKFKALQTAWVFDKKYKCDRLVKVGEDIESDIELDKDKAIATGEAPDSHATRIFERVPEA